MPVPNRPLARRMADIQPFHVMALLARARELEAAGRSIVHMEIGEPDFATPAPVVEAGRQALAEGETHYTPAAGLPALRAAIAEWYASRHGCDISPGRVVVTPGASGALQLVMAALVDPGARVLMTDPGYPCNRHFVRLVEGEAEGLPVFAEDAWRLSPESVAAAWTPATVALLLASPANPTGGVIERERIAALQSLVRARGGFLIMDEIYHGLSYEGPAASALEIDDDLFVINSFSKYFGMTGWRLGWVVAPVDYVEALEKLAQNLFLAAPTPAQYAALAAFEPETLEILEARRETFRARRDFLLPALRELGFRIPVAPQGAFYLYADASAISDDSFQLCRRLLEEAGVAITPGIDFGDHRAREHVRFAYTTSLESLEEGVKRIARFVRGG